MLRGRIIGSYKAYSTTDNFRESIRTSERIYNNYKYGWSYELFSWPFWQQRNADINLGVGWRGQNNTIIQITSKFYFDVT